MSLFRRLFHRRRDASNGRQGTSMRGAHSDESTAQVQFQIEKCQIPIVWLDTSILLNLAKLKLGILKDKVQEDRLTRLRQYVCDFTRKGKPLCPKASQADEVWVQRAHFLDALHELSLDVTMRPKAAIEEAQIHRLMTAYIAKTPLVTFPYKDAFIDDPLPRFAQTLMGDYVVTVDGGLLGTIKRVQSQRDTIHLEWENLRKTCIEQGTTFEEQLQRERVGGINTTISMARDCVLKLESGEVPTENEGWALSGIGRLGNAWNRLGGEPKGVEGLTMFLNSPYYQVLPSSDVSSNIIAHLMVGDRKIAHGDAMDTEHISSVLPYADLMILDRSMRSIVRGLGLDKKYGTTVCYVGDDEEITSFFEAVGRSPVSVFTFSAVPQRRRV